MRPLTRVSLQFWLVVFFLVAAVFLPNLGMLPWSLKPLLIVVALAGSMIAVVWRIKMDRRLKQEESLSQLNRADHLTQQILGFGQTVEVRGSHRLLLALAACCASAALILGSIASKQIPIILGALVLTPLSLFALLRAIAQSGKAVLRLSRNGVEPAGYGSLPWSAIQGIELTELRTRGMVVGHVLRFWMPDLKSHLIGAHPVMRLIHFLMPYKFNQRVSVFLQRTSEAPQTIKKLCSDVHTAITGLDIKWRSSFPPQEAELMQDISERVRNTKQDRWSPASKLDLETLERLAARAENMHLTQSVSVVWNSFGSKLLGAFFVLLVAIQLIPLLTNFVPSNAWLFWSLVLDVLLVFAGHVFLYRRTYKAIGDSLNSRRRVALWASVAASFIVMSFLSWLELPTLIGDPISRYQGKAENLSVVMSKTDKHRRRGCRRRLQGPGNDICLSAQQYEQLSERVKVELQIRRSWFGYHVESYEIQGNIPP